MLKIQCGAENLGLLTASHAQAQAACLGQIQMAKQQVEFSVVDVTPRFQALVAVDLDYLCYKHLLRTNVASKIHKYDVKATYFINMMCAEMHTY